MLRSKAVSTSGCSTPSLPTEWPFNRMSAQRPGKKVESVKKKGGGGGGEGEEI